ncbi:MAG: sulfite exporter TauE/SafE family protein [Actinomycetes bacterium]
MGALLAIPLGLLIGAVLGLVGAGGSIVAVPALVYGVGMSPAHAIPSSLIVVGLGAVAAVIPRLRGGVDWSTATLVGIAGIPAAWLGTIVNRTLDPRAVLLAFAALMVVAGVRMLASGAASSTERYDPTSTSRSRVPRALAVGLLVGFLTGLLGVGGGFIIVPALTLLLGLPMGKAVGTSLVIIALNSAGGFSAHVQSLALDWPVVIAFAATAIAGSLVASRFAARLPDKKVKTIFAIVVLLVAVGVATASVVALVTG